MKKFAFVSTLVLASSLTLAGEKKGPPGPDGALGEETPIAEGRAASICAFSGLNDERIPIFEDTQTQSYGTFLVYFSRQFGFSIRDFKNGDGEGQQFQLPSPGVACNPSGGG